MEFKGLNKRIEPNAIPESQSPDLRNVRLHDETLGVLGPRKGFDASIRPLHFQSLCRVMHFCPGGRDRWVIASPDGILWDVDKNRDKPRTWLVDPDTAKAFTSTATVTLTAPSTSVSGSFTFADSATYDCRDAWLARFYNCQFDISGTVDRVANARFTYYFGLTIDNVTVPLIAFGISHTETGSAQTVNFVRNSSFKNFVTQLPPRGTVSGCWLSIERIGSYPASYGALETTLTVDGVG